jgi:outer membrane lipoprotein-sorting protein
MQMKKLVLAFMAVLAAVVAAVAQTPKEIVDRMEATMNAPEKEGIIMTVDLKLLIVGTTTSKSYMLGGKTRVEMKMMGVQIITWSDGEKDWTYISKDNTLTIEKSKGDASEAGDTEMFSGITDGYDVTLKKETADAWYFLCKKSKRNKEKDDPKTIDLVISKKNYYPLSLKASVSGMTMTMREISFGVTEADVTCDPSKFPGVKIIRK